MPYSIANIRLSHGISRNSIVCVTVLITTLAAAVSARADQTIVLRSGNGAIGSQDTHVRVLRYGRIGDITPSLSDFASVKSAPFAYVVGRGCECYISQLPSDPNAKWLATTLGWTAESALYAIPFQVDAGVIPSASLDLHFSVDNALNGVYINGLKISGNSHDGDYHAEYRFFRNDIGPVLLPGTTNWLYINASDYGAIASLMFSASITIENEGSALIDPSRGGNTGTSTVYIHGSNFVDGAIVRLRSAAQLDILGSFPAVISETEIVTTFDLRQATTGTWTAEVINSDQQVVFSAPFTVEPGRSPQLTTEVIGPSFVRADREATFEVVVRNLANIDAYFVNVQAGLSPTSALLSSAQLATTVTAGSCILANRNTFVRGLGRVVLPFSCTIPAGCSLMSNSATDDEPDCEQLKAEVARLEQNLKIAQEELQRQKDQLATLEAEYAANCAVITPSNAEYCLDLFARIQSKKASIASLQATIRDLIRALHNARQQLARRCPDGEQLTSLRVNAQSSEATSPSADSPFQVCGITSIDPNDKIGILGSGPDRFIRADGPIPYTIFFENLPSASAAAVDVLVSDVIDPSLDLSTLSIKNIRFGSISLDLPDIQSGTQNQSTTVDLRPDKDLLVQIDSSVAPGRVLSVTFRSIDPTTGKPPTDPFAGFLPPNQSPPEGEGSIFLTIEPLKSLPTGTVIRNQAKITFDTNTPIDTPEWRNALDNTSPTSAVTPLAPIQTSLEFPIIWNGADEGAGIRDFIVYMADNDGPFVPVLTNTIATSMIFRGRSGHAYGFFSVARDSVGNVESWKAAADATTTVIADTTPPLIFLTPDASVLWPPNGKSKTITFSGRVTDDETGVDMTSAKFWVIDEYEIVQPSGPVVVSADGSFSFGVPLVASRFGSDRDGRKYAIWISASDAAGNVASTVAAIEVPHDHR